MKTLLSFLFSLLVLTSYANDLKNGTISGKIIDQATQEAIPYATVVIKDKKNQTTTGGITDENGFFSIGKIPEGNYLVEIQFIGYQTVRRDVSITKQRFKINLGTIAIQEDAQDLDEVVVRAETSTVVQKIDRKVINIGKDLTSAGASASEIMNNIQSVSVDQDGNISLRGNSNVRILVDGRPVNVSPQQLLQQIPSTSIKSIELITNPSAKYNPEGMSGIINIVLNKNANLGFNGSVNTGVTYGNNARFNGSLDLNYKAGKFNFFANYGSNFGKRDNYGDVDRFDNNSTQEFDFDMDNTSHLLKTGVDFYINDKNTLSFFTVQNRFDSKSTSTTLVTYHDQNFDDINQYNESESESNTSTYNLNYKHDFDDEGHHIEFEGNYATTESPEEAFFREYNSPTDPVLNYDDSINNDYENLTLNLDYVNPINENSKLELGLESRVRNMDNSRITTQEEYVYDDQGNIIGTAPIPDSFYEYDRNIHSAYATYSNKINKFNFQIGARLESYDVKARLDRVEIFTDDYITVYPSAFISYEASEKNSYQISYSRRVDRPGFQQVNPIRAWSTPVITSVGNPELNPQFTSSIELNYTRKLEHGSITFGTFYRMIKDNITRVLMEDPLDPNKVILTFGNTDDNNAFGFELSSNYRFTKWWNVNASFDLYHQTEKGVIGTENLEVDNTAWNLRVNNDFKASQKLRFQLFGMYRGANQTLQFERDPMWKIDLGARYNILDNKGTLSARFSDIFNSMYFGFDQEKPNPSIGEFHWESRAIYVGFSYRFGSNKAKKRLRKDRSDNETQGGGFM